MSRPDFNPKNVVVAGFRISAAAFIIGMGGLLYALMTGSEWALFWWAFLAVTIPLCVYFFFHETKAFHIMNREGNDWSLPEPRHRMIAAGAILILATIVAIVFYPY